MWKASSGMGEELLAEQESGVASASQPTAADLLRQALTPPAEKPAFRQPPNYLLRTQVVLCALLLLFLFAARRLEWPVFPACQAGFSAALSQGVDLSEQAELVRFASRLVEGVRMQASAWGREQDTQNMPVSSAALQPAPLLGVGGISAKKDPPEGYSVKSYMPLQPLLQPLSAFYVTSGYGWRDHPITGKSDFHTGVDLAAAEGTPISAALPGMVLTSGRSRSYGNYVVLLHADGVMTQYCHMQYVFVRRGEAVGQGAVLGTVGSTGMATGPHLHFELSFDDMHYDPTEALGL